MSKEKYREFCTQENDIPIFSMDWWLDATCGENDWDVVSVEQDNKIVAAMPYKLHKKSIFTVVSQPELTQKLGPYIKYPKNQKYEKKISYEKKIFTTLINKLPKFDMFSQNLDHSITNHLPFYWKGFQQTSQYTYVLDGLDDLDVLWNNLNNKTRTDIRKAEKKVKIIESQDVNKFYDVNKMTFGRQNLEIPYSLKFVKNIDEACKRNNCRKIFFALDDDDNVHAAIYLVWDKTTAYYLMGGGDPALRNSGATHLLIWEAIKFSSTTVNRFDFEGSMIEPVEKFVRSFGAIQKSYSYLTKVNSKILKIRQCLNSFKG